MNLQSVEQALMSGMDSAIQSYLGGSMAQSAQNIVNLTLEALFKDPSHLAQDEPAAQASIVNYLVGLETSQFPWLAYFPGAAALEQTLTTSAVAKIFSLIPFSQMAPAPVLVAPEPKEATPSS